MLFIIDNKFHEEFFCLLTVSCYSAGPGYYVVKFILYPAVAVASEWGPEWCPGPQISSVSPLQSQNKRMKHRGQTIRTKESSSMMETKSIATATRCIYLNLVSNQKWSILSPWHKKHKTNAICFLQPLANLICYLI